jgi:hypothetical protein
MRRKKPKPVPPVEASLLDGIDAIEMLKGLSDEALQIELHNATNTESYLRTMGAVFRNTGAKDQESPAELFEHGAAYSRTTREVILLILFLRHEKGEDGKKNGKGYL